MLNAQKKNPGVNVLTGLDLEILDRDAQIQAAKDYLEPELTMPDMLMLYESMPDAFSRVDISEVLKIIGGGSMDTKAIVSGFVRGNLDDDTLLRLYDQFIATETCEENSAIFGSVDLTARPRSASTPTPRPRTARSPRRSSATTTRARTRRRSPIPTTSP